VRFHFGEVLLSAAARAVAIMLLALPLASVLVFETVLLAAAIFHHSNLRLPAAFEARLPASSSHRRSTGCITGRGAPTPMPITARSSASGPPVRSASPTRRSMTSRSAPRPARIAVPGAAAPPAPAR